MPQYKYVNNKWCLKSVLKVWICVQIWCPHDSFKIWSIHVLICVTILVGQNHPFFPVSNRLRPMDVLLNIITYLVKNYKRSCMLLIISKTIFLWISSYHLIGRSAFTVIQPSYFTLQVVGHAFAWFPHVFPLLHCYINPSYLQAHCFMHPKCANTCTSWSRRRSGGGDRSDAENEMTRPQKWLTLMVASVFLQNSCCNLYKLVQEKKSLKDTSSTS